MRLHERGKMCRNFIIAWLQRNTVRDLYSGLLVLGVAAAATATAAVTADAVALVVVVVMMVVVMMLTITVLGSANQGRG